MLENGSVVVHGRDADMPRVAPPLLLLLLAAVPLIPAGLSGGLGEAAAAWANERPHVHDRRPSKIRGYFNAGESDKV